MIPGEKKVSLNKKVKSAAEEAVFYLMVVVGYSLMFWAAYYAVIN